MANQPFVEYRVGQLEHKVEQLEKTLDDHASVDDERHARLDKDLAILKAKLGIYVAVCSGLGAFLVHLLFGG